MGFTRVMKVESFKLHFLQKLRSAVCHRWYCTVYNQDLVTVVGACCIVIDPGRVAQAVACLAKDARLTADTGVASSIPARSHTFVEIYHEIISTIIHLPSVDSFKKGCCQFQAKVCARITG